MLMRPTLMGWKPSTSLLGLTASMMRCSLMCFKLTGDVAFDEVAPLASYITPVPGGVGPMTIISLLLNTLAAAKQAED